MTLHRCTQPGFPKNFTVIDIKSLEVSIEVADEYQITGCGYRAGVQRGALLMTPHFFHGVYMVGADLAEIAVGAGHLEELAAGRQASATLHQGDFPSRILQTSLT